MDFYKILSVGLGGLLGSIARYITVKTIDEKMNTVFPYGTLTVNILGALLIGFLYAVVAQKTNMSQHWKLFLGTGFCGGFTTFSAFAWENVTMIRQDLFTPALLYMIISLILGILAVLAGIALGKLV